MNIDFSPGPRPDRPRTWLWASVGIGIVVLGLSGGPGVLEATPPPLPGVSQDETEILTINPVIDVLNTPWVPLFETLERQLGQEVRLLGLSADAEGQRVSLQGEAVDEAPILALSARLKGQPGIATAQLLSQSRNVAPEMTFPVRFAMELRLQDAAGGAP